uniref:Uncharacterized protein n=1 Tax=Lactuca sativa TaxID=4236 RepID=A0A9R1VFJ1_LACSA|nr:hypothetical protein LSAT_V11C500282050 [Lactuca sativa]
MVFYPSVIDQAIGSLERMFKQYKQYEDILVFYSQQIAKIWKSGCKMFICKTSMMLMIYSMNGSCYRNNYKLNIMQLTKYYIS